MANTGSLLSLLVICLLLTTDVTAVAIKDFYQFGLEAGDDLVNRTLDGSSPRITLPSPLNFFGEFYNETYVNNNGHITPEEEYSAFIPRQLPINVPLIAVYWADSDTRPLAGGYVWYRTTTEQTILQQALEDVRRAYPSVMKIDYLLIATWDHVGYYLQHTDKTNTFQCVLAVSGSQTYAIYLYALGLIQWTTSDDQGGINGTGGNRLPVAGYNAGDSIVSFMIPGSLTDDIIKIASTSNVLIPGMWVFRLDKDDIVLLCSNDDILLFDFLILSPSYGSHLGGTLVRLLGPCFNPYDTNTVECSFDDKATPGIYVDQKALCVSPDMDTIGRVEVKVMVKSDGKTIFNHTAPFYSGIIANAEDSIFSYQESLGESWDFFHHPDYMPTFSPTFDDPALEEIAVEICGDSQFCLFDIAATKRPEIGTTTAVNNEEFDVVVNMSQPVICDPPCENGACVATNTCMCAEAYSGDTCSVPDIRDCEENVCKNGGTCHMLAGSFICTCPPHLTGVSCELLLPPKVVSDSIEHTPLISVPLLINPIEFGFIDYRQLISLCYEVRGTPRHTVNSVSTKYTSINARYARLSDTSSEVTFEAVGVRGVDSTGNCNDIQINRDCSVTYNGETVATNLAASNVSIELSSNLIQVSIPNGGKKIVITVRCLSFDDSPVISFAITRSYIDQDITHGLIGQFWSAEVSSEVYTGDPAGLTPGYDAYTMTVDYPQASSSRKFVGALLPRLWNHTPGQCIYAGNSVGGSTGTGPSAPMDSVIEGQYRDYRVRDLFGVEFAYSKFESRLCQ